MGCIQKTPPFPAAELFAPDQNTIPNEGLQCIDVAIGRPRSVHFVYDILPPQNTKQ